MIGLMVDSDKRSPLFPDIPTIPEATGKDYAARSYFGLVAPPGTPKPIAAKLQAEVARIAGQPDFRKRNFIERGLEPVASTPDAFAPLHPAGSRARRADRGSGASRSTNAQPPQRLHRTIKLLSSQTSRLASK